jgi:hypothetical protein
LVSAPRNRVELICSPIGDRLPGPADGWARSTIFVEEVRPLPGSAPVLGDAAGRQLTALLPPPAVHALPPIGRWRVEAELVGPATVRVTADPAHLEVLPDSADDV